jgi:bifunctional DNase/RNase
MVQVEPVEEREIVDEAHPHLGGVLLREKNGERSFAIFMQPAQVVAIRNARHGVEPTRPSTHDLLQALMEALGGQLESVVINEFRSPERGGTFFAQLQLRQGERTIYLDARPSDAIALAMRSRNTPIQVEEEVLAVVEEQGPQWPWH